jgi:dienelactone hydrolase
VNIQLAHVEQTITVPARFNLPRGASATARVPAVVYLHGYGGITGAGAFYADALNDAGIATLELDMWAVKGLPATVRQESEKVRMAELFGALLFLANQPAVDPDHIGLLGASMGAEMTIRAASRRVLHTYINGASTFAAHLALYPGCYTIKPETLGPLTAAPVALLIPGNDAFSTLDDCTSLAAQLHAAITVYPGATHEWDTQSGPLAFHDSLVDEGRGGTLTITPSLDTAKKSRAYAVDFFRKAFTMP